MNQSLSLVHFDGGIPVFYFIGQSASQDYVQWPAIHIFPVVNHTERTIALWTYRIAFPLNGLYVETRMSAGLDSTFPDGNVSILYSYDSTASHDLGAYSPTRDVGKIKEVVTAALDHLPYYVFLGISFYSPDDRDTFSFIWKPLGGKLSDITTGTEPTPMIKQLIDRGLAVVRHRLGLPL